MNDRAGWQAEAERLSVELETMRAEAGRTLRTHLQQQQEQGDRHVAEAALLRCGRFPQQTFIL